MKKKGFFCFAIREPFYFLRFTLNTLQNHFSKAIRYSSLFLLKLEFSKYSLWEKED